MNEDANGAATDTSVDNINSDEGGVSADEVASVLNLPKVEAQESEEKKDDESEGNESSDQSDEDAGDGGESGDRSASETGSDEAAKSVTDTESSGEGRETPTFTIEVEDANGTKFTIGPDDSLDEVLAEFEPKNNGQIFKIIEDHMQARADKKAFDAERANAQAEAAHAEQIATIHAGWDKEIQKLQGEKRLPLDAKIDERKNEIFKFMADENEKRQADGRPLLQSFEDALDKLENQESKDAAEQAKKDAKEEARRRGGLVGGSSAPATSGAPAYKAGQARSASEAIYSLGLLDK